MRRWPALLCALCLAGLMPAKTAAQSIRVDRAQALLHDAQTALNRVRAASKSDQLAALGQAVKAHETALSTLRLVLRKMAAEDQRLSTALEADRAELARLLSALQSIGRAPQSALLAFPGGPAKAARAAILMAELTPALESRTAAVEAKLSEIRTLRTQQETARVEARGALASLQDLRARTAQILRSRKKTIPPRDIADQAGIAAQQARNLGQLATVLGRIQSQDNAVPDFAGLRGALALPVEGRLAARYGDAGRTGFGITIAAPAFAEVRAPVDGTIRYAGPLKGYGTVAVIEPEAGWMIVLAGLSRIDREIGETVSGGEKIGDLGGPLPTSEEFLLEASDQAGEIAEETLYIEFRRGDQPVDPAPWFQITG